MNRGKLDLSLSEIDDLIKLYRSYLNDRELTQADISYLRVRVPELLSETVYLQQNLTPMDYDYLKYRKRDLKNDFADVGLALLNPMIVSGLQSTQGKCHRCMGERYLRGIDMICDSCGGNNTNCEICEGTFHTLCSRCNGVGNIYQSKPEIVDTSLRSHKVFCLNCGTELPNDANFCSKCGKPANQNLNVESPSPQIEYTEQYFDWKKRDKIEYSFGTPGLINPGGGDRAGERKANIVVRQRIDQEIQPFLAKGWMLDGPFDAAVKVDWIQRESLFNEKVRAQGAWVRFRRYM